MYADSMSLTTDLNEKTKHGNRSFPIQYYVDELYKFRNMTVPLHWHSELEFFVAYGGKVQIQIQDFQITLNHGDGIFLNSGILHSFHQADKENLCCCPNIVFSKELIGSGIGLINQHYIVPIIMDNTLPFIILNGDKIWHKSILKQLDTVFSLLQRYGEVGEYTPFPILDYEHKELTLPCYEMQVQVLLSNIWQILYSNLYRIPRIQMKKKNNVTLIRMQKMLEYIELNYFKHITLNEIATIAHISKSEANRCFQKYMKESPVSYLIGCRIEHAKHLLEQPMITVKQISIKCGFQSTSYFVKLFHKETGLTPLQYRNENSVAIAEV